MSRSLAESPAPLVNDATNERMDVPAEKSRRKPRIPTTPLVPPISGALEPVQMPKEGIAAAASSSPARPARDRKQATLQSYRNYGYFTKQVTTINPKATTWYYQAPGHFGSEAGDCAMIRVDDTLIIIDGGRSEAWNNEKTQSLFIKALEQCNQFVLIITHWHDDHSQNASTIRTAIEKKINKNITNTTKPTRKKRTSEAAASSEAAVSSRERCTVSKREKTLHLFTCSNDPLVKVKKTEWEKYSKINATEQSAKKKQKGEATAAAASSSSTNNKEDIYETVLDSPNVKISIFDGCRLQTPTGQSVNGCDNWSSLGTVVTVNDKWSLLSLGDMEKDLQGKMFPHVKATKFDVVKMAHHGSKNNMYGEMLKTNFGTLICSGHTRASIEIKDIQKIIEKAGKAEEFAILQNYAAWIADGHQYLSERSGETFAKLGNNASIYHDGLFIDLSYTQPANTTAATDLTATRGGSAEIEEDEVEEKSNGSETYKKPSKPKTQSRPASSLGLDSALTPSAPVRTYE